MESVFSGNELWQLVAQSDYITKMVFLLLLGMSISCWTIFLWKIIIIQFKKRQLNRVLHDIVMAKSVEELAHLTYRHEGTFGGYLLGNVLLLSRSLLKTKHIDYAVANADQEWNFFVDRVHGLQDRLVRSEESGLAVLSMSAAVAPLLGLFGTVWGLIHSFLRINEKQMADIVTIAPGIAEALMTTLAGLLIAIPALVLFNCVHISLRGFEQKMEECVDVLCTIVHGHCKQGEIHASFNAQTQSQQTAA